MTDDQIYTIRLMHGALEDFLGMYNDPNMPMETLLERAAQAVILADQAFLKELAALAHSKNNV